MPQQREKPSLCESCIHYTHIQGETRQARFCHRAGDSIPLTERVWKCTDYFAKTTLTITTMERIAFYPDEKGVWKKPERKAGFAHEVWPD